jgi:pimeloyl-ACP methyl ester carboxylesterase
MGRPTATGTEQVCVTVTVPRGATMPAQGWPAVLYAHGTGGSYRSVVAEGISRALSSVEVPGAEPVRFATVGFEGVLHGRRRGDGVTESPDVLFFNFANPEAARDNVLQGAADVHAMVRALGAVRLTDLPAMGAAVAFDPRRVVFFGHSQGATVGVPAVAYEPGLAGVVLSGAGGDLRASLTTKRRPIDIASAVPVVLQEAAVSTGHPALNLLQAFFERSDAVNYGRLVLAQRPEGIPARPVFMSYGLDDTYSTIETQQALAGTLGLPVARERPAASTWPGEAGLSSLPFMNNAFGTTAGLLQALPAMGRDGHFVIFDDERLRRRAHVFIATASRGAAVIPN